MDADSKLEQYLLLGKNAGGLAAADLIKSALAESGLFAYGELLELPCITRVIEMQLGYQRQKCDM